MASKISQRLTDIIDALPLKAGMRVLEIGCGPGVAAREIVNRFEGIYVLAVDRSQKAIEQAKKSCKVEIETGRLKFIQANIENFELPKKEQLFDIAFAIRVGALDGRHPEIEQMALEKILNCLNKTVKLFIDGGNPIKEIDLKRVAG